ncbi:MAG: hypothetical protein C5B49_08415 [Bdellovibrio sp.]|nr:MAG: hypothetical protein C5B49_08415 [Bdellovibrio sp.]
MKNFFAMKIHLQRHGWLIAQRFTFLSLAALITAGCTTYFLRKDCESKNWHEYGFDLAMKGVRPSNDDYIGKCRKAEANISEAQLDNGFKEGMANYCRPDVVRQTGRRGENLNLDLCDPGQTRQLQQVHAQGLREFCQPDSGFTFGSTGKVYGKICPADLEAGFLKEYQRGRKKYLSAMVVESQQKVADLDHQLALNQQHINDLQFRLATLPPPQRVVQRTVAAGAVTENSTTEDTFSVQRQQIQFDLDRARNESSAMQNEQAGFRNKMYEYQRELTTLE